MFDWIVDPNAWLALGTLTILEIVLGIDNVIFLSLVVSISWVIRLTYPLFSLFDRTISLRDIILILGGLFLIWKSSREIHQTLEGGEAEQESRVTSFVGAIVQIMLLDIIFSLDSVITAVGLSNHLFIMMLAVVLSVGVMMFAARPIGEFVARHPSVKMLALSFLILIGFTLILEGVDIHVPKGYIYFAMFFSMSVEALNLVRSKKNNRHRRAG